MNNGPAPTVRTPSLRSPSEFILQLPKAELHLHLEGAIAPGTLVELARNHGRTVTPEELPRFYHYTDFTGFLACFRAITKYLRTPEDYELAAYRLLEKLAAQNVRHAEIFVAVGAALWWGRQCDDIFAGLERGRLRGEHDFGISVYWIFDAVRHLGPEAAQHVAEHAVRLKERGSVVGFGLGGDERRAAPELFREVYAYCARHGLRLTCHAGEVVGPHSVWGALSALGSERIGHGTSCWQDPSLLAHLLESQVPLEVSLTSNLRTGAVASLADHPLKTYYDLGLMVTLNTDDPELFGASLNGEYQLAQDVFGFTDAQLAQLARNSFAASFLPEARKREYCELLAEAGQRRPARVSC
jgi:adenosine deaminase/aminodeoxyfutalosine deaminase